MLNPATDTARAQMIRSAIWGWSLTTIRISAIPSGTYQVYLTVWEDNNSASFDIRLEGSLVRGGYQSGSGGRWERLGPWPATISDGTLDLTAGPDANLSGIELWHSGSNPPPPGNSPPTVGLSQPAGGASDYHRETAAAATAGKGSAASSSRRDRQKLGEETPPRPTSSAGQTRRPAATS